MRVIIEPDRCVGAGQCVLSAPEVFDQDDETGMVVVLRAEPDEGQADDVRTAVDVCPAQAIALTES